MIRNGKQEAAATEREQFVGFFPQIVKDLTEDELHQPEVADAVARMKEVVEYNAIGGKYNRGLTVTAAFQELTGPDQQDQKNFQRALAVGWCVELLQAFFLVADDIMDYSVTRRGHPCWYKKLSTAWAGDRVTPPPASPPSAVRHRFPPTSSSTRRSSAEQEGIGLDAVNDSFLLESSIYRLLKRYCRSQPYYLNLLELFLQTSYQTELGQALDLITAPPSQIDLSRFTEQRYKAIVKYKTAFYSFYLPVAAAMYMAGIDSEEEHEHARAILLEMGEFFQIQDDFLDCFGDPAVTGKIGTDIQDNKCSWLVVECLKRASADQRRLLEENYGQKDLEKVAHVKQLYEAMGLKAVYQECEESSYQRLSALISQHAVRLPSQIFFGLAQKIYKRQK